MSLSASDWKKNKARTLVGETVTPALTELAKRAAALKVPDGQEMQLRDLSAYGGALKILQAEIAKTRAKCVRGIHDQTGRYLDAMAKEATAKYAENQQHLKDFNEFLKAFQKLRASTVAALEQALKSPLPPQVAKARQVVKANNDWLQSATKRFNSDEIMAGTTQMASAILILDRILKAHQERTASVPGGRALPATPADLVRELDDAKGTIAKLKTPGGFFNKKYRDDIVRTLG